MIATATSATAPESPAFPASILQLVTAGSMEATEASSRQWIIAFGIAGATAVAYKTTRRHRRLHARFLPIMRGLTVMGAACFYPELLHKGIGLISAFGACEKSFRRHFFWGMTHLGDVVHQWQNAASSILKMFLHPIAIYGSLKLAIAACKSLLPLDDKVQQDLEIVFTAVAHSTMLGGVCYHFCQWKVARVMFSFQRWVVFNQPFVGLVMLPIYFVESFAFLVCGTAYSFVKAVAEVLLLSKEQEGC